MAISYTEVVATGSPQLLAVPEYLDQSHIHVSVDGVDTTSFSWVNSNTVAVTVAAGSIIRVYRSTSPLARVVDYTEGVSLTEQVLDTDSLQAFYLAQEMKDRTDESARLAPGASAFDIRNKQLKNVGAGTAPSDGVNKAQLDALLPAITALEQSATDSKNEAAAHALSAGASAGQALSYLQAYRATSYGALSDDPLVDPNGNPPTVGDEYFNTTSNLLKRFNGATWQASDISTANLAAGSGASLVGVVQPGAGAVARTVQDKIREVSRSVKDYGATGNGVTDDTSAWQNFAASISTGGMGVIPAGTYIVGAEVLFSQDNLTLVFERGAVVKQKSGAGSIDSLLKFTGSNGILSNPRVDANLAGNPVHPGRGQLIDIAGSGWTIENVQGEGSQDNGFGTVLYVTGSRNSIRGVTTNNTGSSAVRNRGDNNVFRDLEFYEYADHGFVTDASLDASPFTFVSVNGVRARTTVATATEAILFDPDGIQGGLARVRDVHIEAPNNAHADVIKFVYVKRVEIDGLRCSHADDATQHTSLRFQEAVESVAINNAILDGAINFDATVACDVSIMGRTIVCNAFGAGASIQGLWGTLTVGDGVEIRNAMTAAIGTDGVNDAATTINLARVVLHGKVGSTPNLVQFPLYSTSTRRRIRAGQISVADPLRVEGTMKSLAVDGRWIGLSETQDVTCRQGDGRRYLAGNSDFPPRDSEGWRRSDVVHARAPAAGGIPSYVCVTPGAACRTAWAATTAYALNAWVFNGANVYVCTTAGTSAGSGGPAGTGTGIADGTVVWDYVDALAVFRASAALA